MISKAFATTIVIFFVMVLGFRSAQSQLPHHRSSATSSTRDTSQTATEDRSWRWNVKTLNDDTRWLTAYGMPWQKHYTIRDLTDSSSWPRMDTISKNSGRIFDFGSSFKHEYSVVNVRASIVGYIQEDDGDIHLILTDNKKDSMIAEVPDPNLMGSGPWQAQCAAVRKWLLSNFGEPARYKGGHWSKNITPPDSGYAYVVGIPFYDKRSHGRGAGRNGIEIHPVLGISLADDN